MKGLLNSAGKMGANFTKRRFFFNANTFKAHALKYRNRVIGYKSPLESFEMARCTKSSAKTIKLQSQIKICPNSGKKSKPFHKSLKYGKKSKPKFGGQTESEKSKIEGFGREKSKLAALVLVIVDDKND